MRVLTPWAVPNRQTDAFWCANTPTVTTPGHWLTCDSNASGSVIDSPLTSRICWPLSVTSASPFLNRTLPAQGGKAAVDVPGRHRDHLDGQGKLPQCAHQFRLVGNTDEALGQRCHDLLARQRGAAALEHMALAIDFVGPVDADR